MFLTLLGQTMLRLGFLICGFVGFFLGLCPISYAQVSGLSEQSARQFPRLIDLPIPSSAMAVSHSLLSGSGSIAALQIVPIELTVDQVAAMPADAFAPFNAHKTYSLSTTNALWLHFRLNGPAVASAPNLTFELPKSFVDRVEFYHRHPLGGWTKQQAGDAVYQSQWAVRGLYPQFHLPQLSPGPNDFYVKVIQQLPLRFDVRLTPSESVGFANQNALLANGLLLGLLLFVSLFALVLGLVYRNKIYGWYAAYVGFVFLAMASYSGVAFYAFWPAFAWFADRSPALFLTLAIAAQLQFGRVLFIDSKAAPRTNLLALITVVVLLANAMQRVLLPSLDVAWRVQTLIASVSLGSLVMFWIVLKAAFVRRPVAWLWMLAYSPVLAVLALTVIEQFGLAPLPWLPYNAIGLAVGFEVLVLLMALHLHVKSNHAWAVRQTTLIELDPLTGFLAPLYYPDKLAHLWSETRHLRQDIAIAYLRAEIDLDDKSRATNMTNDQLVLRCVRMLHMVTHPDDTVARIGGNMFAILMPGMSAGSHFSGKLLRLQALGLMLGADDQTLLPVRFRIVATTFKEFSGTSGQLDSALKLKLGSLVPASGQKIEFVRN